MKPSLIIIPCYNEASRIQKVEFLNFFEQEEAASFEFLFVNDGSTDNTRQLLEELCNQQMHANLLDLKRNHGKAEAIREGIKSVSAEKYSYLGYFDADLSTPLNELFRLQENAKSKNSPYMVLGSRIKILGVNKIERNIWRHYVGRIFATLVSNILQLPIYDTQCGAKIIRSDLVEELFKDSFISAWLFDVEILFRMKKSGRPLQNQIIEMPLNKWVDKAGSKIKFIDFIKAPFDLFRIYMKYK